jgi:predicted nucleic acid-binding protein
VVLFVERKALYLHSSSIEEQQRMRSLMKKYQDVPMDLADASQVCCCRDAQYQSDFFVG